jgi:parallel beta-helix repeat protein
MASPTIRDNYIVDNTVGEMYRIRGGGIYCYNASPIIFNNVIADNDIQGLDSWGAGINCSRGSPVIMNNTITRNVTGLVGGGIYCRSASALITNNVITENLAPRGEGGGVGSYDASPVIVDNYIAENRSESGGGIFYSEGTPTISGNLITKNIAQRNNGGGILCLYTAATIRDNMITGNKAESGGGISCYKASPMIQGNLISGNTTEYGGAGLLCWESSPSIVSNRITDNIASGNGGSIYCSDYAAPEIIGNTMTGNAAVRGGAVYCYEWAAPLIKDTILWGNVASSGKEIYLANAYDEPSSLDIRYSDLEGGLSSVYVESGAILNWGAGMMDSDPLFVAGPDGDQYLSQISAGQAEDSPCLDSGDPASVMIRGTTRTDLIQDAGVIDIGYHYPTAKPYLLAGPGPQYGNPPVVGVYPILQDGIQVYQFNAYGASHYGVNVSCGDVDGEGREEILTGPGPSSIYSPHVRGFHADGTPVSGLSFFAYGTRRWGVHVAAGNLDHDFFDEIITGAGPGAVFGPHVRAFDFDGTPPAMPISGVNYFAYGTRKWGVQVSAGDIDGDGFDEIITGAGPGAMFGPHVRGWDVDAGTASAIPTASFLAYGSKKYGVNVGTGDLDGDEFDEIITAPGPSGYFASHIRGWNYDGQSIIALPGYSYFAWASTQARFGAKVFSGADLDEDGRDECVTGCGPDTSVGSPVKVFVYDGSNVSEWFSLQAFPPGWNRGTNVAAGWF